MANVTYLTDCSNRLVAMEKAAVLSLHADIDAVPYTFHIQTRFPFWTNTLAGYAPSFSSEIHSVRPYLWICRYHMGFVGEANFGDLEKQLYTELPYIENYFQEHVMLTSTDYPDEADHLDPFGISISLSQGLREVAPAGGEYPPILGTVIEVITPFNITIAQQD